MAKHESEETRKQQILTAAAKCLSRYGYHKMSVDAIAKESKLSKGAIYWYYKSKEEVLLALSDWRWKQNLEYIGALAARVTSFKQFLDTLYEVSAQYMKQVTYEQRSIHELNALSMEMPELNRIIADSSLEMHKIFVSVIKRYSKSGELRKNVKADEAAIYIRCLVDGFAIHAGREDIGMITKTLRTAFSSFYNDLAS